MGGLDGRPLWGRPLLEDGQPSPTADGAGQASDRAWPSRCSRRYKRTADTLQPRKKDGSCHTPPPLHWPMLFLSFFARCRALPASKRSLSSISHLGCGLRVDNPQRRQANSRSGVLYGDLPAVITGRLLGPSLLFSGPVCSPLHRFNRRLVVVEKGACLPHCKPRITKIAGIFSLSLSLYLFIVLREGIRDKTKPATCTRSKGHGCSAFPHTNTSQNPQTILPTYVPTHFARYPYSGSGKAEGATGRPASPANTSIIHCWNPKTLPALVLLCLSSTPPHPCPSVAHLFCHTPPSCLCTPPPHHQTRAGDIITAFLLLCPTPASLSSFSLADSLTLRSPSGPCCAIAT